VIACVSRDRARCYRQFEFLARPVRTVSIMTSRRLVFRAIVFALACALFAGQASAADIKVMISGGFSAAYGALVPQFEQATGDTVETAPGPSMGTTPNAIPVRLARGEPVDVLIMVGYALDDLIKQGKVAPESRVDLARSYIGVAVRAGAPRPDLRSAEAFNRALLAAKSIAYSDSASGVYVSTEMFQKLGVADAMKGKARMIPAEPVGAVVARGRGGDRFAASERTPARARDRLRRTAAGGNPEGHGVLGRRRRQRKRARRSKGAHPIPLVAGSLCEDQEDWPRAGCGNSVTACRTPRFRLRTVSDAEVSPAKLEI